MTSVMVVGGQWGDEGKGKIVDLLSFDADHVVRAQGGANAGHTVVVGQQEYKLHLIPSGILHPDPQCYLGAGVVIDGVQLLQEIAQITAAGITVQGRLWISPRAHLVLPYHKIFDGVLEKSKGSNAIGTTGRGIGPCYADRTSRVGLRVGDLLDSDSLADTLRNALESKNDELENLYGVERLSFDVVYNQLLELSTQLTPYIANVELMLIEAYRRGENILLEGAQGTLLDTSFGTYPYVTSSATCAAGICLGAGLAPRYLNQTLMVVKAYCTRVGNGPFPTEDCIVSTDHVTMREVGTTTGRKRRLGWFDAVLARWAVDINGADFLAITKLDILDTLPKIKVCVGYRLDGHHLDTVPASSSDLNRVEPIYEVLPGWQTPTSAIRHMDQLPRQAQDYLQFLAHVSGAPIGMVSVGPERSQTFVQSPLFACKETQ